MTATNSVSSLQELGSLAIDTVQYVTDKDLLAILAPVADAYAVADQAAYMRTESKQLLAKAKSYNEQAKALEAQIKQWQVQAREMQRLLDNRRATINAELDEQLEKARHLLGDHPDMIKTILKRKEAQVEKILARELKDQVKEMKAMLKQMMEAQKAYELAKADADAHGELGRKLFDEQKAMLMEHGLWVEKQGK